MYIRRQKGSQALSVQGHGTPSKLALWDSHISSPLEVLSFPLGVTLDLLLESLHWESFDYLLGRFRSHFHVLAEDVPHACLRGWLCAELEPAESGKCEDAGLFHLLGSNRNQGVDDVGTSLRLELMLLCHCLHQCTLRHCFGSSCLDLHRRHDLKGSESEERMQIYKCNML